MRSKLYFLLIWLTAWQMVFYPMAPVLAEEASAPEIAGSTPPVAGVVASPTPLMVDVTPSTTSSSAGIKIEPPIIDQKFFKLKDAFTDVADLGNGQRAAKFYLFPRPVFRDTDGVIKKRPAGWSLFDSVAPFQKKNDFIKGYEYTIKAGDEYWIKVEASDLEMPDQQKISPRNVDYAQFSDQQKTVTQYDELYPGITVKFSDSGYSREREIILKNRPDGIDDDQKMIFWERYILPAGFKVMDYKGEEIKDGDVKTGEPIVFSLPDGNHFNVGSATVFDAISEDKLDQLLGQKVHVDRLRNVVYVGVEISGRYLNDNKRVYPVTIDPIYYLCKEGQNINTLSCAFAFDFYLAQPEAYLRSGFDAINLVTGRYLGNDGFNHYRQILLDFPGAMPQEWQNWGDISSASLVMTYVGWSHGDYTDPMTLAVRKVLAPWQYDTVEYGNLQLSAQQNSATVIQNDLNTETSWDITSIMREWWQAGANSDHGLLIEPSGDIGNWPNRDLIFASSDRPENNGPYIMVNFTAGAAVSDLTFSGFPSVLPNNVNAGQQITFSAQITNAGGRASNAATINYYFDGTSVGQQNIAALAVNGAANFSFNYAIPAGTSAGVKNVAIIIDAWDGESFVDNNTWAGTVDVANDAIPQGPPVQQPASPPPANPQQDINHDGVNQGSSASVGTSDKDVLVARYSRPNSRVPMIAGTIHDQQADNTGGDPVNVRNGAFEFEQTDYELPGRGVPIKLTRTYNSKGFDLDGRFGHGWSHSYNMFYYQNPTTKDVQVYLGGALVSTFSTLDDGATYVGIKGDPNILYVENNYFIYQTTEGIKYKFGIKVTDNIGLIEQIIDTNNNIDSIFYLDRAGTKLISSIFDASGRELRFQYGDANGPTWDKIELVFDMIWNNGQFVSSRQAAQYQYDNFGNLVLVTQYNLYPQYEDAMEKMHTFSYDTTGQMTQYIDPRGTKLRNTYDTLGRVLAQEEHNPRLGANDWRTVYRFTYSDIPDANVPDSMHCTTVANYRDDNDHYDEYSCYNADDLKIYSRKGDNIERWSYNSHGMMSNYTDAVGNVTTYEYDAKRRITKETLPDTQDWHMEISYSYFNNLTFSRLQSKTETATSLTDPNLPAVVKTTGYTIDQKGNIISITNPAGGREAWYGYNNNGTVAQYTNKRGLLFNYTYDALGNYVTQEMADGIRLADNSFQRIVKSYIYDNFGNKTSYTDPRGNTFSYIYDTDRNLRMQTDPMNGIKYYRYDTEDHKVSETDELGRLTEYTYDTDLNASLRSIKKAVINFRRQYDYLGNLLLDIDPLGRRTEYQYDSSNRLQYKYTPYGNGNSFTSVYTYNNNGLLRNELDGAHYTTYSYDSRGNRIGVTKYISDDVGLATRTSYDGFNRVVSEIDGNGNITTYSYDLLDCLTQKIDALGNINTYICNFYGDRIGEIFPRANEDDGLKNTDGRSVSYSIDSLGRARSQKNADNKVTLFIYDENNNLARTADRQNFDGSNGTHTLDVSYDSLNRKIRETFADGGTIQYAYDAVGNLTSKTDQQNATTTYQYDGLNRLVQERDPAGNSTRYGYDAVGNKISVTYPDNSVTRYAYDDANKLISITDARNNVTSYTYDEFGNKTGETDKRGHATRYSYDNLNRLVSTADPKGTPTSYTYDNNNNRLTETITSGAGSQNTSYQYDKLNHLTKIIYPGNKTEQYSYDANGNKQTYTDGQGQVTIYIYDKLDRPTNKTLSDNTQINYTYDSWNNFLNLADQSGTTTFAYDVLDRPITETKVITGLVGNKVVSKTYTADGKLASITDAAGRQIVYNYNNRGLLDNVTYGAIILLRYTYNSFGKPSTAVFGNGLNTAYTYDTLNRVASIETKNVNSATVFKQVYQYDAESNRTVMIETRLSEDGTPVTATTNYAYDNLDQLTDVDYADVNGAGNDLTYRYDSYGNRTSATSPFGSSAYTYTPNTNELASVSHNNGRLVVANQYDNNGSLTKETYTRLGKNIKEVDYSWNSENRLAGITYRALNTPAFMPALQDNTLNFVYDDYGNRVKKSLNNSDITYYLNDGLTVLNELDSAGNVNKTMVKGLDPVAEILSDGSIQYVHTDALGSTVLLTNEAGNIVRQYEYDSFGQVATDMGDAGKETKYTYTNQEYDPESELYYYNARYYNPALGRFISRDTVLGRDGDTLSRNLYIYVKNNPLKYVDPTGNEEEKKQNDEQMLTAGDKILLGATGILFTGGRWLSEGARFVGGKVLGAAGFAYELFRPEGPVNAGEAEILAKCGDSCYTDTKLPIISAAGIIGSVGTSFEMRQPMTALRFSSEPGVPINLRGKLVKDIIDDLKSGKLTPKDLPVGYAVANGHNVVLNNKSFSALRAAGMEPLFVESTISKDVTKAIRLLRQSQGIIFDILKKIK